MAATFDTFRTVKRLREAGASEELAEAVADALRESRDFDLAQLATKADLQLLEQRMTIKLGRPDRGGRGGARRLPRAVPGRAPVTERTGPPTIDDLLADLDEAVGSYTHGWANTAALPETRALVSALLRTREGRNGHIRGRPRQEPSPDEAVLPGAERRES